jgi:hypothetical protein
MVLGSVGGMVIGLRVENVAGPVGNEQGEEIRGYHRAHVC